MWKTKFIEISRKRETVTVTCPACSGGKVFSDAICGSCAGIGKIDVERDAIEGYTTEVPVPAEYSIAEFFEFDGTV